MHSRCLTCAKLLPTDGARRCGECLKTATPITRCIAAVDYHEPWKSMIWEFKFRRNTALVEVIADIIRYIPDTQTMIDDADDVVAIPLSKKRLVYRGYNHAKILADKLARDKDHSYLLKRIHHTQPQHTLTHSQRIKALKSVFTITSPQEIQQHKILLIDDVYTTGATLKCAAQTFLSAGAQSVSALVFARTN